MKKNSAEKLDKAKALFEKLGVNIEPDQIKLFLTTFELQKNDAIAEAVKPIQEKLEEYQKRNFELAGALEEAQQIPDRFEHLFEEKIKELSEIKVPNIPDIESAISKALTEKLNLFEKKIAKLDEAVNKINEKILPLNMADDLKKITDIGTLFANYQAEFARHLVDIESAEIKKLKESVVAAEKKAIDSEKKSTKLQEQVIQERSNTEITILLENSPLDRQEKEHLYKYYEKLGFEEGKSEIEKFIAMKETKEREKPVQRSYVRENVSGGVKPMNETGILRKGTRMGESTQFSREMEKWASQAGIDEAETV